MKKNNIIIAICTILIILSIILFYKNKSLDNTGNFSNYTVIYDKNGIAISDLSTINEVTEVINDITIMGIVEVNDSRHIYIFNGQHFGEFGFEIEEYTRANINNENQKCIDYFTLKEYDTSYIEEGDLIICNGDLIKKGGGNNDFSTKDNSIIVLKLNDYNKMKKDALNNNREYPSVITIGDTYIESGYFYIKYTLKDNSHINEKYDFPFVVKAYITENTQIIGNIQKGKAIKVQYENSIVPLEELKLKSLEVIED